MKIKPRPIYLIVIITLIIIRACVLQFPALLDPTEARYATIAQRMVETGQYIIPEVNRGDGYIPFWGKPPLHFWMTALSLKVFGFNEFAARFPSFLCLIGVALLIGYFGYRAFGSFVGWAAPLILLATPVFTFLFCTCIVDTTLTFCVTGAMVSFALCVMSKELTEKKQWSSLYFIFLALGFMTKGPLCLALGGGAIFLWCLSQRSFIALKNIFWIRGVILFLLIAAPWFIYAETLSPGFLNYFFIHENFQRFLSKDYGDIYGSSHATFRGITALLFIASFLPWTALPLFSGKITVKSLDADLKKWGMYCVCWGLAPAVFFLPSNNVIITYLLPGIPALTIVATIIISQHEETFLQFTRFISKPLVGCLSVGFAVILFRDFSFSFMVSLGLLAVGTILFLNFRRSQEQYIEKIFSHGIVIFALGILGGLILSPDISDKMSTKTILAKRKELGITGAPLFVGKLPYSALFYQTHAGDEKPLFADDSETVKGKDIIVSRKSGEAKIEGQTFLAETRQWKIISKYAGKE